MGREILDAVTFAKIIKMLADEKSFIGKTAEDLRQYIKTGPYGIVYRREIGTYGGRKGYFVWDFLLWNELTFEDMETGAKISLGNRLSDQEMKELYRSYIDKLE